jgi:uncharacterized phage-associated protein
MATYHPYVRFFAELAAARDSELEPSDLSHLKLQKLLYYAQGWSLATLKRPLFDEPIKAWEHGPVVEHAYHDLKCFKRETITLQGLIEKSNNSELYKPAHFVLPEEESSLLEQVYETYAIYSAWGLREMTHNEKPWQEAHAKAPGTVINHEALRAYFEQLDREAS